MRATCGPHVAHLFHYKQKEEHIKNESTKIQVYTYILFILLYGANALGGTSVMEFCSSRLEWNTSTLSLT
jgi:hypothetical protein